MHGRRRHGKSILLRTLCEISGGMYHQAIEGTESDQLRDLGQTYARQLGLPVAPAFTDWEQAVDALLALGGDAPVPVVLDEFPYLVAGAVGLPSRLQRALDARRGRGPRCRLILCGSAMTVMPALLAGQAPLRGRASSELAVGPFSFPDAARFAGLAGDARLAIAVHAVCGGVPGYYVDMLAGDVPADADDFDAWMIRGPLNPTRPLLHEARHLLDDEPRVRDKAVLLSVLAAIAGGDTTSGAIAGRLGRDAATVAHPLSVLADMHLVARREDALRAKRPNWQITDPLLRLYAAVMRRDWARLEQGRAREVWRDAEPVWRSRVLGPHLEQLARDWATDHAAELVPAGMSRVGSAVLTDAAQRSSHEIDIVGLGIPGTVAPVVLLGEVKHQRQPMSAAGLDRLRRIRDLLDRQGKASPDTRLLLVSASGFTPELEALHRAGEVLLAAPENLLSTPIPAPP
ncbi:MAG: AAA family ATPase [Pseudonocardiaceae bacterium]